MAFPILFTVIPSVLSAVSAAVSAAVPAVSSFIASVGPALGNVLSKVGPALEAVSSVANSLLQNLSILKPGQTIAELGERILQAAEQGITMGEGSSFGDYLQAINQITLDPDKSATRTGAEKVFAGLAVSAVGLEDKFDLRQGALNGLWLLPMLNPTYFTAQRLMSIMNSVELGSNVLDYFSNKLSAGDKRDFQISLEKTPEGHAMSTAEKGDLYDALDEAQARWDDIKTSTQQD